MGFRSIPSSRLRLSRFSETLSAASRLRIFVVLGLQILRGFRIFASSHLRGIGSADIEGASASSHLRSFGHPDFLKPPHSFASSHLHGIGPADIEWASAASHLRIFATSAIRIF